MAHLLRHFLSTALLIVSLRYFNIPSKLCPYISFFQSIIPIYMGIKVLYVCKAFSMTYLAFAITQ